MKGTQELVIGIVAIVAIIAALLFLMFSGFGQSLGLPAYQNPGSITVNVPSGDTSPTAPATRQSISDIFHAAIDPVDPTFLHDRSVDCAAFGGVWHDQADTMGCIGMAPGTFDPTMCMFPPMSNFAIQCNAIAGATWVCNADSAACYYA